MRLGNGHIDVRAAKTGMLCRVCGETMQRGDIACGFAGSMGADFNFHRVCMKRWLEYSYDTFAPTPEEITVDPHAQSASRIEMGRTQREWDEYRRALLMRYGLES